MMALLFTFVLGSFSILTTSAFEFGKLEVISDLLPVDCYTEQLNYTRVDKIDGLPKCIAFKGRPTYCSIYYYPRATITFRSVLKPTCRKDAWFQAVQCKGNHITGRCFCYDDFGQRLYGQQWWEKADDMTCACSRRKAEMTEKIQYFNSLHCSSEGNFETLQCDVESRQCWCSDKKTGDLISTVVPDTVIEKLPCYNSLDVGSQYLRQCDSKLYAQKRILYELALHGTKDVSFGVLLCDEDGSYGAYKVVYGTAYCTWKDDTKIGSYQYAGNRISLNCNCARDIRIFEDAGKTFNMVCEGSGNYKPFQDDLQLCVDASGFRITRPTDNPTDDESCKSYPQW